MPCSSQRWPQLCGLLHAFLEEGSCCITPTNSWVPPSTASPVLPGYPQRLVYFLVAPSPLGAAHLAHLPLLLGSNITRIPHPHPWMWGNHGATPSPPLLTSQLKKSCSGAADGGKGGFSPRLTAGKKAFLWKRYLRLIKPWGNDLHSPNQSPWVHFAHKLLLDLGTWPALSFPGVTPQNTLPFPFPMAFTHCPCPEDPRDLCRTDMSPPGRRGLLSQPSPWLLPSASHGFGVPLTPPSPFPSRLPAGTAAPARLAQISGIARALPDAGAAVGACTVAVPSRRSLLGAS